MGSFRSLASKLPGGRAGSARWSPPATHGRQAMARPATVFAKIPNQEQRDRLVELWKQHPNHYTRMRAHALILSDAQYEVEQIVDIFGVSRDSVRAWIKRFTDVSAQQNHCALAW